MGRKNHRRLPMGAALGVLDTIRDIGEAGGPIVAGFIIARASYEVSFLTGAWVLVAIAVLFAIGARMPRHGEDIGER